MPRITVLMPVYNGMPYIPEAVDSVLSQSETDWELIISDNGSTDGTRDYLRTLTDPRIRVHYQDTNLGIFGNLNFLLEQSRTDIAKILCADDVLLPGALTRIAAFMEERPWCAVSRCWAQGDGQRFGPAGRGHLIGSLPARIYPQASNLLFATFGNIVGNLSKAACRPKLVLDAGGFDQSYPYAGDYEGWMRVAARHGIALHDEELIMERHHEQQNSNLLNKKNEMYPQLKRLLESVAPKLPPENLPLLRRHWTIHFFAQRIPKLVRQAARGQIALAAEGLKEMPFGISPSAVIAAYPLLKLDLPPARKTSKQLFDRIIEINDAAQQCAGVV
ncbi:MAG TPA: glycosyltransferase family 2 protein [Bellilinea sp.]|nr:glycosyltransferase family 2 protein [Bellilinea sp.]